jgi:crossover junction endodeoxyribonuclease RusA
MNLSFFVPGIPATAGSKSAFLNKKTGKIMVTPANKKQKPWMSHVKACALDSYAGEPTLKPVTLELTFKMPRPKAHYGTGKNSDKLKDSAMFLHTKKPDLTKMLRAVEDALTGIVWKDDSQVCQFYCCKHYTEKTPGVEVNIIT